MKIKFNLNSYPLFAPSEMGTLLCHCPKSIEIGVFSPKTVFKHYFSTLVIGRTLMINYDHI